MDVHTSVIALQAQLKGIGDVVGVGVRVGLTDTEGVILGVFVGLILGVFVGLILGVLVGVILGVFVGVLVGVKLTDTEGVIVGVVVGVFVGVVGKGIESEHNPITAPR